MCFGDNKMDITDIVNDDIIILGIINMKVEDGINHISNHFGDKYDIKIINENIKIDTIIMNTIYIKENNNIITNVIYKII